jgi:hypothetical protein
LQLNILLLYGESTSSEIIKGRESLSLSSSKLDERILMKSKFGLSMRLPRLRSLFAAISGLFSWGGAAYSHDPVFKPPKPSSNPLQKKPSWVRVKKYIIGAGNGSITGSVAGQSAEFEE